MLMTAAIRSLVTPFRPVFLAIGTTGVTKDDRILRLNALNPRRNYPFNKSLSLSTVRNDTDNPTFKKVTEAFIRYSGKNATLVAHNAPFHAQFLREEFKRAGLPIPPWLFLDTLALSRILNPELTSHKLENLVGMRPNTKVLDQASKVHLVFSEVISKMPHERLERFIVKAT
jgi:DNA polymerase III alpha subunit (gram-positive type)